MLVALLLFTLHAQASCEWVEISQQHYLKPARTTRVYPQITVIKDIERTTKVNRVYVNSSLTKPNWNRGAINKVPGSDVQGLIGSETVKSKPINFDDKPRSEVSKKTPERVYYNKDNVKRITFTNTEESLKPLEVFNLSDLDYNEGDFPTIEVDDGILSDEQFERTKHLTAVIPTEDEDDNTSDNLPNTIQSHNKNHDKNSVSNKAAPKKDIIVERKTSPNQNLSKSFKRKGEEQLDSTDSSVTDNSNKIVTLIQKPSSNAQYPKSEKIKQEDPKYNSKNSSDSHSISQRSKQEINSEPSKITNSNKRNKIQMLEPSETSSHKGTQENPKLKKNVLRINELPERPKIRNPEEVMLEEILHESDESFEDLNHKTLTTGTVKKVSSKSTITRVIPKINVKDGKDMQAVESQIQRTKNKNIETDDKKEIHNNVQKNIIKESVTTTISSKIEESKEFEDFYRNAVTPLPVGTEKLFEHNKPIDHKEDRPRFVTTLENNHSEEQENQNVFVLTATSNQEETKINVKPSSTETTATVKVEFTTKPTPIEQITTASDEKVESVKSDSKKPPEIKNDDQEHERRETEETLANDSAADTLETLVKVLKLVTETISRNSKKSVKGKMRYLEELRDTIMASIEQRLEAVFPDDGAAPRRARSARAQGRGHVEFPSSESALMTISFLTFAVFLIKLVLQVIQAYKHKAMMPAVVATMGRAYHQYSQMKADDVK